MRDSGKIFGERRLPAAAMRRSAFGLWLCCCLIGAAVLQGRSAAAEGSAASATVKVTSDEVYGSGDDYELRCDIYEPAAEDSHAEQALRPAVILIHGGAWVGGSRVMLGRHAMRLAREGFVAVSIDYRLAPQWKFPAQVDDVRTAMLWLAEHAERLRVDPDRIGLYGYSAGGHLACMIGTLDDRSRETQQTASRWAGDDPRWSRLYRPAAICAGGPPCDLTTLPPENPGLAYFLGGTLAELPDVYAAASPVTHASAGDVPTLFYHGARDAIVPIDGSRSLYQAQRAVGVPSEYLELEGQGHLTAFINPATIDAMVDFFRRRLIAETPHDPKQ